MKSKNLIWVGLGAVALYLYFRNKPKAVAVTPKVEPKKAVPTITKEHTLPKPVNTPRSPLDLLANVAEREAFLDSINNTSRHRYNKAPKKNDVITNEYGSYIYSEDYGWINKAK